MCIVIACLCLAGTLADMCVVQESWKFWIKGQVEYAKIPRSGGFSNHSDGEAAPLLSSDYGYSANGSSVQVYQPNQKERGNVMYMYM